MADADVCVVCGEPVDAKNSSICHSCGQSFHLNPRNDLPGKDCGAVWINEQHLALEFACQRCLDGDRAPEPRSSPQARRPRVGQRRYRKRA